jgi:C-methyltransferase C-terminal domain/Putative zinc binding domain
MLTALAAMSCNTIAAEPACRLCGARLHHSLLDLGSLPLATRTLAPGEADRLYPLHVWLCDACGLAQIADIVSLGAAAVPPLAARPEPSVGRTGRYAETLRQRVRLDAGSLVIEVGPTDGLLLRHFEDSGIAVLGIPADAVGFNTETAMQAAVQHGCADLVVAHHILPQAADLFDCAAGLACILRPKGVLSMQFPHLLSLIQRVQFDAFRHDTYTYLSLPVIERLLRSIGLRVFDAERVTDDGGSLRVLACHAHSPLPARPGVKAVRQAEALAVADPALYAGFNDRVAVVRDDIRAFLQVRREAKRRVAAYGATARGATLLNCCDVTEQEIACVADTDTTRHGRLLPGSRIPIVPVETLMQDPPDDVIILPWPNAAGIALRLQPLRRAGAQFWTMLPRIGRV